MKILSRPPPTLYDALIATLEDYGLEKNARIASIEVTAQYVLVQTYETNGTPIIGHYGFALSLRSKMFPLNTPKIGSV